jgi:purine-nucleoside phosphorylase
LKSTAIFERAQMAAHFIQQQQPTPPTPPTPIDIAVVLGSGLGAFAETLRDSVTIPYEQIPEFARSTVEGHSGRLVIGQLPHTDRRITVAAMQGRFHFYEGYDFEDVTLPMRTFGVLGVKKVILTNAAGGVNPAFKQGSFMLISDHINLMLCSPLRGRHDERLGARFPDMTEVYSKAWRALAKECAAGMNLSLNEGVYLALQGPNYETPAEVRMARLLGGDAVGMSTVPEAIVAKQMGMEILGLSLITNAAAGISEEPINHAEVMGTGRLVSGQFLMFLQRLIDRI